MLFLREENRETHKERPREQGLKMDLQDSLRNQGLLSFHLFSSHLCKVTMTMIR